MPLGVAFPENKHVFTFGRKNEMLGLLVIKFGIYKKNWAIMLDISLENCTERIYTIEAWRFHEMQ